MNFSTTTHDSTSVRAPTRQRTLILTFALILGSTYLFSPLVGAQTMDQAQTLAPVIVTATRHETRADELVSDVTVIDRTAIDKLSARTLPEILTRLAGVQMSASGGAGTLSNVFLRGTESRHTVILIDGVRYGSATTGTPIWENIPVDMIDHIEILQGPASSLYGSDAVGGVVQIFTRQGVMGVHPRASLMVGSHGYSRLGMGVSGGEGRLTYALDAQHLEDKGFSATNAKAPWGDYNPDRDGFRQSTVNGRVTWQINDAWKLDAGALYVDGLSHYDDGPSADSRSVLRTSTLFAGVQGQVLSPWKTRLKLSQSNDTNDGVVASWGVDSYKTKQNQISWQNEVDTPVGIVLAGLERLQQHVDSSVPYTVTNRRITAGLLGLNGSAGSHSWQVNMRRDQNSQFGEATTGFAGYGYQITPAWKINASYGTSFVAPSFNQLYYPGWSNPLLQPEKSKNGEVGLSWGDWGHQLKLVYFINKIQGFITSTTTPENIPRARIDGTTLAYHGDVTHAMHLNAAVDYLDARNEVTMQRLARRSRVHATLGTDYAVGRWVLGANVLYVGKRFDDSDNLITLPSYTTGDLFAKYRVTPELSLEAKINNVANKQYETAYGYNQPGRELFAGLRYSLK